jgi:hypothetical protein
MEQITTKFGVIKKNGVYTLFEDGTVNIFNGECEVFAFETAEARLEFIGTWLKADIQAYLTANGIEWTTSMTKAQLLELCG